MINAASLAGLQLPGGIVITAVEIVEVPMRDSLGREAIAQTTISGRQFQIALRSGLSDEETSVSLYHEVLEAMTVAVEHPPDSVLEFNEGDFEKAARSAHMQWGIASGESLRRMLQSYGFREE